MLKKLFGKIFYEVVFIIVLSIIAATPYLQNNISPSIKLLLFVVGVAYLFLRTKGSCKRQIKSIFVYGAIYGLIVITYLIFHISQGKITTVLYSLILFTFPILIYAWVNSRLSSKQVKHLFHFILIIYALNLLDSIRLSILYPVITYQIALGLLEDEGILGLNLGGSSFLTTAIIYVNIVFFSFHQTKDKRERILFLIYLAIALWFIVFCSYKASVIIIALLSLLIQYVVDWFGKSTVKQLSAIALILIIMMFISEILYLLSSIIGSDRISERLLDANNSDSLHERSELWGVSLHSWLGSIKSIFFGIGEHPKVNGDTSLSGIGRHSDVLDTLARYGIFGFYFIFMMFVQLAKYLKLISKHIYKSEINAIFLVMALIALTKQILYPDIMFAIFFLLPLCVWSCYINNAKVV